MNRQTPSRAARVKGWCPGAYRPMMSGDGLVVRVRPRMGTVSPRRTQILTDLARRYGSGMIDLTSRGNLQPRGVAKRDHDNLLEGLLDAGLLDATPELEARRNILTTPFPDTQGQTQRLHDRIVQVLPDLPELPAKMGIALDTGDRPVLFDASADFRIERGAAVPLILRADGAATGRAVTEDTVADALTDLANWFVSTNGTDAGRMHRHMKTQALPVAFQGEIPRDPMPCPEPGPHPDGFILGAAFGALEADALDAVLRQYAPTALRILPWRMFLLEGVAKVENTGFIEQPGDRLMTVHACPGAPSCAQAEAKTRPLAKALAGMLPVGSTLHVSGCSKGCAFPSNADLTLVGSNGKFDLVRAGAAWDEPVLKGLAGDALAKEVAR